MPRRTTLLVLWLLLGGLMVYAAGLPPVTRTQEGRVLETAREMLGKPARDWLVPRLNGAVRLRKPPLAYWLAGGSMQVFGVNERAARLPATAMTWLSLAAVYALARRWFDRRTAFFSAAALASSWLFFRHGSLAETDAPAAAFLTIGAWAIVRAADLSDPPPDGRRCKPARPALERDWPTLHAAALCMAGVILSKGPSVAYLLLFWVALCSLRRNWRSLSRFLTRGGLVTLLMLAVPWFVYVKCTTPANGQLGADLTNSVEGGDHRGPPWAYVPMLLRATLPWTIVWLAALWVAADRLLRHFSLRRQGRFSGPVFNATPSPTPSPASTEPSPLATEPLDDSRLKTGPLKRPRRRAPRSIEGLMELTAWAASIFVPLCVWGNKQPHYLLPLMPATMVLVGWAIAAAVRRRPWAKAVTLAGVVTAGALMLTGPAVLIAARRLPGGVRGVDLAVAGGLLLVAALVAWASRPCLRRQRHGRDARATIAVALNGLALIVAIVTWLPNRVGGGSAHTATDLSAMYPDAHFAYRGTELPVMSWTLRRAIPLLSDPDIAAMAADPKAVVLDQQQEHEPEPMPPGGFVEARKIREADNTLHVYVPAGIVPFPGMAGRGLG